MSIKSIPHMSLCTLPIVAALAIALLSGCGGGGDGGGEASADGGAAAELNENGKASNVSKAEYAKDVNAICKKAVARFPDKIGEYIGGDLSKIEEESSGLVEDVMVPGIEEEIEDVAALGAPPEATKSAEELIGIFEVEIEKAEEDPEAFVDKGEAAIEAQKKAKALGFKECGPV
jgi:hypothetical protein